MPITQARMLEIVEASEDTLRALDDITRVAKELAARYPQATREPAFGELFASIFTFVPSSRSMQVIALERLRYDLTISKNMRKASQARKRRGEQGEQGVREAEFLELLETSEPSVAEREANAGLVSMLDLNQGEGESK